MTQLKLLCMFSNKINIHWKKIILISFIFPILIFQFEACTLWVHERAFPKYATYEESLIPITNLKDTFYLGNKETFKIENEYGVFCIKIFRSEDASVPPYVEKMNCKLFEQISELKIWKISFEYSGLILSHDNSFLIPIGFVKEYPYNNGLDNIVFKLPENITEKNLIHAKHSKNYAYLDLGNKKDSLYHISNRDRKVSLVAYKGNDLLNISNLYESNSPWQKIEIVKLPKNIFVMSIKYSHGIKNFLLIDEKGNIPIEKNFIYIDKIREYSSVQPEYIPLYPFAIIVDIACLPLIPFSYIYMVIKLWSFRT